ncbi:MAG: outer membrane beta-barrel protein, partial [Bacteroidota bacterium]
GASAQKISIKGQLLDTLNSPLPSATVMLLSVKDSLLVNFGVSDVLGNFEIKNVARTEYLFKVTFVGFKSYIKKISAPEAGTMLDLGKVRMEPASNELDAIEIEGDRAPVTVKKDTIEFNAAAFKTKQNAMVEDLLKKLPGVEVDNDGNVTAQGEQVRRVTVDGKNFFGNDPKVATRNLPADAVDKVQVFDKKSDQTTFSGIDDGQREKTINLELKEEKRKGAFGNITAGAGTNERLMARASINRFTKGKQLSFLGMGNNINDQGFSMEDYMNFTGGSQQMMSGGGAIRLEFNGDNQNGVPLNFGNRANGIMTTYAGGVNFNNEFNKKTEANGSYFYNYLDHNKDQTTLRQNFLPNGSFTFNQNSQQRNNNFNHRANFTLDHKLDSLNSLKLTTNVNYNETDAETLSTSANTTPDNVVQNENQRRSLSNGSSTSLNSTLLWRHKFRKKGRTFSTHLQLGLSQNERQGFLDAVNTYYGPAANQEVIKQTNDQTTDYKSYGGTVSYTEPLGKRKYLEANYTYRQNLNDVNRSVYDVTNDQPEFNALLSNLYTSDYQYHRAGLNFRLNRSKYNLMVGNSIQKTNLKGDLKIQDVQIDRSYQNMLPSVRFNYDFSNSKHLRIDYETSVQEPSIQQLQPVVDNSDPLNLYVGNPNLRPAYSQSWRVHFMTFNPMTFISFFSFMDIDYTTNAITNAQNIDDQLVRTTMPVNVNNNLSVRGDATFAFPISKIKSRFSIGTNYRNQRSINLLNDTQNTITQQTAGTTVRYSYRYKEIFDLSLSADVDHQLTKYEFQQPDQTYLNETYTAESNLSFLKNFQFSADFNYLVYNNKGANFNQAIPLLNMSVSAFMLKNKTGELKLSVNNLLDKALGINQTASINYLERTTTNSLGRYFMLSFTYSINKQLNPMGIRRGGAMMRIMR